MSAATVDGDRLTTTTVDGPQVHVHLGQRSAVRLEIGSRRYSRTPSYDTPWVDTTSVPLLRGRDLAAADTTHDE